MDIPYSATNFAPGSPEELVGDQMLQVTWTDIVWSAITAGKPGASHLLAHRWHSMADTIVRSHTIYANLRQVGRSMDRSSLYDALDPTEKGATSYFLGMAMAKLFAARLFDIPWLFHVSLANSVGANIRFRRGSKSQPDLIGQNSVGDWIVVEAKGRTNGFDGNALLKAKLQTGMIRSINGAPPSLRVALQVYFSDQLRVCIDDPIDVEPDADELELDLDAALASYYAVAEAITKDNSRRENVDGREFVTRKDNDSGVTIGLEASIWESVATRQFQQIRQDRRRMEDWIVDSNEDSATYPDGLLVRLDSRWSPQVMGLEPSERDS